MDEKELYTSEVYDFARKATAKDTTNQPDTKGKRTMIEENYNDLQELTGHESGAVQYADGAILVCNWTQVQGIPRMCATGLIGLGETLTAVSCDVPDAVKQAMTEHEREQGADANTEAFACAWRVNDEITVVTQSDWA